MKRFFETKEIATQYSKHRLRYSDEIARCVLDHHSSTEDGYQLEFVVDVGCGSGQSTNIFQPYCKKIIGIDVSSEQIKLAQQQNSYDNIQYIEGTAEKLPFMDNTVDLVVSAVAVHWFDLTQLYEEVRRVLKPTGSLAILSYDFPTVSLISDSSNILTEKASELLKNALLCCPKEKYPVIAAAWSHHVDRYNRIFQSIPFTNKERKDDLYLSYACSVADLFGLISSQSSYYEYLKNEKLELEAQNQTVTEKMMSEIDPAYRFTKSLSALFNLKAKSHNEKLLKLRYNVQMLLAKP